MNGQPHETHILSVFRDRKDVESFENRLADFLDVEMASRGGYSFSVKALQDDEQEAPCASSTPTTQRPTTEP